jgi:hypothetical protein
VTTALGDVDDEGIEVVGDTGVELAREVVGTTLGDTPAAEVVEIASVLMAEDDRSFVPLNHSTKRIRDDPTVIVVVMDDSTAGEFVVSVGTGGTVTAGVAVTVVAGSTVVVLPNKPPVIVGIAYGGSKRPN